VEFFARTAVFRKARRLEGRRGKSGITAPAAPAMRYQGVLISMQKIVERDCRTVNVNYRSNRNFNDQILAAPALAIAALTMLAAAGLESLPIAKWEQCVELIAALEKDIAAVAAITAAGTAPGNILFAPECYATPSAVTRFDMNPGGIDKHKLVGAAGRQRTETGKELSFDLYKSALGAARNKLDLASHFRKQRIILAHAHIQTGAESAAPLSYQNGSSRHQLSVKALHT
jgi:hypothetical protein